MQLKSLGEQAGCPCSIALSGLTKVVCLGEQTQGNAAFLTVQSTLSPEISDAL